MDHAACRRTVANSTLLQGYADYRNRPNEDLILSKRRAA